MFPSVVLGTLRGSGWSIWHISLEYSQVALIIWVWTFFGLSCSGVTFWEHLEIPVVITRLCLFWVIPFIWDCIMCVASQFLKGRCCYHYYQPWYIIMFVIHTYLKYGVVQETLFRISCIGVRILVLPIASQLKWPLVRYLASELLFTYLWTGGITASSHELL